MKACLPVPSPFRGTESFGQSGSYDGCVCDEHMGVMVTDIRRSYVYARATRDMYAELPREDPLGSQSMLGKLSLCLYGTRDAATTWQETLSKHLEQICYVRGAGHSCVSYHRARGLKTLVHGDDYVTSCPLTQLRCLKKQLEKQYACKSQELFPGHDGSLSEGKVLNRVIRFTGRGREFEADQRHAELLLEQNPVKGRGVSTPGIPEDEATVDDGNPEVEVGAEDLVGSQVTSYRGMVARCSYLGMAGPDVQFSSREVCREMSSPSTKSMKRLQRIVKYLKL